MCARLIAVLVLDFLVGAGTAHGQQDPAEPPTVDRSYKLLREDEDWSFLRDSRLRQDFWDPTSISITAATSARLLS